MQTGEFCCSVLPQHTAFPICVGSPVMLHAKGNYGKTGILERL